MLVFWFGIFSSPFHVKSQQALHLKVETHFVFVELMLHPTKQNLLLPFDFSLLKRSLLGSVNQKPNFPAIFSSSDSRFTQQELPACKPILTPKWVTSFNNILRATVFSVTIV